MKRLSVIVLVIAGLAFSGMAEAAKKKRTRNANRVGPYASAMLAHTSYTSDQSALEQQVFDFFDGPDMANTTIETEDTDMGYQAAFGFRFNRYLAAELALVQLGELSTTARGDLDIGAPTTFPASMKVSHQVGGPLLSLVGVLPLSDKFEIYGRAGVLFANSEREIVQRVDGQVTGLGRGKGDSSEPVFGIGATYHFNQIYSARAEFMRLSDVGEDDNNGGTEDIDVLSIGAVIRF